MPDSSVLHTLLNLMFAMNGPSSLSDATRHTIPGRKGFGRSVALSCFLSSARFSSCNQVRYRSDIPDILASLAKIQKAVSGHPVLPSAIYGAGF